MADYGDVVTRIEPQSDIVRVLPGALVQICDAGTLTVAWEGTADTSGNYTVPTLPTGQYDVKVNGVILRSFHHVKTDHTHDDELWRFHVAGAITVDQDESSAVELFGSDVAGTISRIKVVAQSVDALGDVTVHLLKGASSGGAALTMLSDSVWTHRINPASAVNRYLSVDNLPAIAVAANEVVTIGLDFVAAAVAGITVSATFRKT